MGKGRFVDGSTGATLHLSCCWVPVSAPFPCPNMFGGQILRCWPGTCRRDLGRDCVNDIHTSVSECFLNPDHPDPSLVNQSRWPEPSERHYNSTPHFHPAGSKDRQPYTQ